MTFLKNKLFIAVLFGIFAVFAVVVIIQASRGDNFLYYEGDTADDVFNIIDTLE
ncbi:hypothetical protein COB87_003190 [Candidatus Wolfebacteria bacterium]|nr:hypothetical protein [Candidatus Wolfebacteria bacterium]